MARQNKAPSVVPAQAKLARGRRYLEAPLRLLRLPGFQAPGALQGWEYLLHLAVLGRRPIKPPLQLLLQLSREPPPVSGRSWRWPPDCQVPSSGSRCLGLCSAHRPVSAPLTRPVCTLSHRSPVAVSKRRCRTRPSDIFPMQSHLALKLQDLLWLLYKTLSNPFKPYLESQPALQMASTLTS